MRPVPGHSLLCAVQDGKLGSACDCGGRPKNPAAKRTPARPVGAAAAGALSLLRVGGSFLGTLLKWALIWLVAGIALPIGIHAGKVITLAACSSVLHIGAFRDE